jgi:hypothetical protein
MSLADAGRMGGENPVLKCKLFHDPGNNLPDGGFAPRTLSKELLWKSKEGPSLWAPLVTEIVWNEFGMQSSFTTILKGRRFPLSFLHRELDINLGGSGA